MDDHERVHDLAPEYALGVLDPEDRDVVDAHLAGCADCRRDVGGMLAVSGALATSLPPAPAPPELRARILAAATGRLQPVVSRRQWGGWVVGVAAAIAAAAVGLDDVRLRRELTASHGRVAQLQQQLALQRDVAQPVLNGQQFVRLAPVSGKGPAALWVNPPGKAPYLAAPDLPDLGPNRTYELWFLRGAKPLPAGTFPAGSVLTLPQTPQGTTAMAITVEPRGGSATPTTAPIMLGKV